MVQDAADWADTLIFDTESALSQCHDCHPEDMTFLNFCCKVVRGVNAFEKSGARTQLLKNTYSYGVYNLRNAFTEALSYMHSKSRNKRTVSWDEKMAKAWKVMEREREKDRREIIISDIKRSARLHVEMILNALKVSESSWSLSLNSII